MIPDPAEQPTVPLWPTAGQAFGLGRARTFELARHGELPFEVYRLGRSWRVPTAALRRVLHLDPGGRDRVNYPAMRWAVEDCQLEGVAKPILFVIAYRADRDTGECWSGQRRIAREAGVTRTHVQRVMTNLIRDGVLEVVEAGSGTKPDIVRIAPAWVEGDATASGLVEGTATATNTVEGTTSIAGEVIHSPSPSGHMRWPQGSDHDELVATLLRGSGHMETPEAGPVATSGDPSGHMTSALTSENAEKGFNQGFRTSRERHVLDDASPAADAARVVEAPAPPPSVLAELERRGLRPSAAPKPKPEQQPRSREEQLAILERIAAEDEAKAKNGQEGKESA